MDINTYLMSFVKTVVPNVQCADGFDMSVQASHGHYCVPTSDTGPWSHVEVYAPSEDTPEFYPYQNGGVYDRVPVELINAVIEKHGGFKKEN